MDRSQVPALTLLLLFYIILNRICFIESIMLKDFHFHDLTRAKKTCFFTCKNKSVLLVNYCVLLVTKSILSNGVWRMKQMLQTTFYTEKIPFCAWWLYKKLTLSRKSIFVCFDVTGSTWNWMAVIHLSHSPPPPVVR